MLVLCSSTPGIQEIKEAFAGTKAGNEGGGAPLPSSLALNHSSKCAPSHERNERNNLFSQTHAANVRLVKAISAPFSGHSHCKMLFAFVNALLHALVAYMPLSIISVDDTDVAGTSVWLKVPSPQQAILPLGIGAVEVRHVW